VGKNVCRAPRKKRTANFAVRQHKNARQTIFLPGVFFSAVHQKKCAQQAKTFFAVRPKTCAWQRPETHGKASFSHSVTLQYIYVYC
jgi:hypothetical protein